jgi:hypothetical protein
MTETIQTTERILSPVADACHISGLTKTHLYEAMGRGDIEARKCGRRTLVDMSSLRNYVARLPPARFGAARQAGVA